MADEYPCVHLRFEETEIEVGPDTTQTSTSAKCRLKEDSYLPTGAKIDQLFKKLTGREVSANTACYFYPSEDVSFQEYVEYEE
jgi:hypothetical protein